MNYCVQTEQVQVAETGEKDKAGLGITFKKASLLYETGEPYLVGRLFVPPVVIEYASVGGGQRVAVASVEGT